MIEDKLILSRRQALAIATGTVSASALLGFATGTADAQSAAGQVGTSSQPIDVEANTISFHDDFTLKFDAQNQELFGEDPLTGDRIQVPFDSVNINSVNTGGVTVASESLLTTQGPVSVDTSSTLIFDSLQQSGLKKGLLLVYTEGGGADEFIDLLLYISNETVTVISGDEAGSAPTRNYFNVNDGVSLSLSSGSQDVVTTAIEFAP